MKEKLSEIIEYYGVYNQKIDFNEECMELLEAITSYELHKSINNEDNLDEYLKNRIAEEIADCLNVLYQFIEYYNLDKDDIKKIMKAKVDMTINKIKER